MKRTIAVSSVAGTPDQRRMRTTVVDLSFGSPVAGNLSELFNQVTCGWLSPYTGGTDRKVTLIEALCRIKPTPTSVDTLGPCAEDVNFMAEAYKYPSEHLDELGTVGLIYQFYSHNVCTNRRTHCLCCTRTRKMIAAFGRAFQFWGERQGPSMRHYFSKADMLFLRDELNRGVTNFTTYVDNTDNCFSSPALNVRPTPIARMFWQFQDAGLTKGAFPRSGMLNANGHYPLWWISNCGAELTVSFWRRSTELDLLPAKHDSDLPAYLHPVSDKKEMEYKGGYLNMTEKGLERMDALDVYWNRKNIFNIGYFTRFTRCSRLVFQAWDAHGCSFCGKVFASVTDMKSMIVRSCSEQESPYEDLYHQTGYAHHDDKRTFYCCLNGDCALRFSRMLRALEDWTLDMKTSHGLLRSRIAIYRPSPQMLAAHEKRIAELFAPEAPPAKVTTAHLAALKEKVKPGDRRMEWTKFGPFLGDFGKQYGEQFAEVLSDPNFDV